MPDHLHLFAKPSGSSSISLKHWIFYWKRAFVQIHKHEIPSPFWQKDFWDIRLRKADSYAAKWIYVENNPVRHRFVQTPKSWRFKGEIYPLEF